MLGVATAAFSAETAPLVAAGTALLAGAPAGAPHFVQNFVSPRNGAPHFVQKRFAPAGAAASFRRAPHFVQNASRSVIAAPHCLHEMLIAIPLRRYFFGMHPWMDGIADTPLFLKTSTPLSGGIEPLMDPSMSLSMPA